MDDKYFDDFDEFNDLVTPDSDEEPSDIDSLLDSPPRDRKPIGRIVVGIILLLLCVILGGVSWVYRDKLPFPSGNDGETDTVLEIEATAVPTATVTLEAETVPTMTTTAVATPTATTASPTDDTPTDDTSALATSLPCIAYVQTFNSANIRAEPTLDEDNILGRADARQTLCVVEEQLWPEVWYRVEYAPGEYGWIGSTQVRVCFSAENC